MNVDRVNEKIDEAGQVLQEILSELNHNERLAFMNSFVASMVKSIVIAAMRPDDDDDDGEEGE